MIINREALILADGGEKRALALQVLEAGVRAVDPREATRRVLKELRERGEGFERVKVLAFGKAAAGMVEGALEVVRPEAGMVVAPRATQFSGLDSFIGSHPELGAGSLAAGECAWQLAAARREDDTFLVLVSGGGSAMLELPEEGVDLALFERVADHLRRAGAAIHELNTVRMALSRLKGGGLAARLAPARVINVVISDVPGMAPSLVASGPTAAPVGSGVEAGAWRTVLERYGADNLLSASVVERLEAKHAHGAADPEGAFAHVQTLVAADSATARDAMVAEARSLGRSCVAYPRFLAGEARTAGELFVRAASRQPVDVVVASGETTVTVKGAGRGGRNQEFVLGAHALMRGTEAVLASMGTDGVDGSSNAAGALLDRALIERADRRKLSAPATLGENDSHRFFAEAGGAILTGPTGTNVADLVVYVR